MAEMLRPDLRNRRPLLVLLVATQVAGVLFSALLRLWIGVVFFSFLFTLFALELQPSEKLAPSRMSRTWGAMVWALALSGIVVLQFAFATDRNAVFVTVLPLVLIWILALRRVRRRG